MIPSWLVLGRFDAGLVKYMRMGGQRNTYRIYAGVVVLLLALSMIVPKGQDVLWINGNHTGRLDLLMSLVTNLGDGMIFIPVILFLLFVRFQYALMAAVIGTAHGVLIAIAKQILFYGMPRPKSVLDHSLLHFVPGVNVHAINAFPSGHTTTAFCLALFLALLINKKSATLLFVLLALLVGYSRIYLLQHFLVDVAAGAMLGSLTTCIVWQALHTRSNHPWMNLRLSVNLKKPKRVQRLPG